MGYDPSTNPRYLGPTPGATTDVMSPAGIGPAEIEDRVRVAREVQEVFKKRGWRHIKETLEYLVEDAARSILDGRVQDMDGVREKRSLIQAYQTLIDFPESAAMQADYWNSLLHE